MPSFPFESFLQACKEKKAIFVSKGALLTASTDFNLATQEKLLDFIACGGLENPVFKKSDPWVNNKSDIEIMADIYYFFSGPTYGYLAFCYSTITNTWIIKSFKKNNKPDPRSFTTAPPLISNGL